MSLSILARSRQAVIRVRSLHTSSPARSSHDHYHHLPFQWPGEKKAIFGMKLFAYLSAGFAIPFGAAKWQLYKQGGS